MKDALISFFEKSLNHYLALDPESASRIQRLHDRSVTIELLGINLIFQLYFADHKIYLKTKNFVTPNTIIKGTPLSLLRMTVTQDDRKQFFAEDVMIEGNLELGQDVIDLFDRLEIDWEEYLSHFTGDVPAHHMGRIVYRIKNFNQHVRRTILENINEFIHEEADLFPPVEALQDFYNDVDDLRMDVDRIEAQIELIKKEIM